jgi:xanthine dehydrogenase YagR molybdenum-binding subunit
MQMKTTVRIVLSANGHAEVACATSDIGTGTYTIMAQVTADMLGLPLDDVTVKLGDSTLPQSPVEGGSWMAASVSNAIATTCNAVRKELLRLANQLPSSPLADAMVDDVALAGGKIVSNRDASLAVSIADVMRHREVDRIEQETSTGSNDDGARLCPLGDLRRGEGG